MSKNPEQGSVVGRVLSFLISDVDGAKAKPKAPTPSTAAQPAAAAPVMSDEQPAPVEPAKPKRGDLARKAKLKRAKSAAKIKVVNVAEQKSGFGKLWTALRDKLMDPAEAAIKKQLGPNDQVVKTGADEYLVTFADAAQEEAQRKTNAILRDVRSELDQAGEGSEDAWVRGAAIEVPKSPDVPKSETRPEGNPDFGRSDTIAEKQADFGRSETKADKQGDFGRSDTKAEKQADFGQSQTKAENQADVGQSGTRAEKQADFGQSGTRAEKQAEYGQSQTKAEKQADFGQSGTKAEKQADYGQSQTKADKQADFGQSGTKAEKQADVGQSGTRAEKQADYGQSQTKVEKQADVGQSGTRAERQADFGQSQTKAEKQADFGQSQTKAEKQADFGQSGTRAEKQADFGQSQTRAEKPADFGRSQTRAEKEADFGRSGTRAEREQEVGRSGTRAETEQAVGRSDTRAERDVDVGRSETRQEKDVAVARSETRAEKDVDYGRSETRAEKETDFGRSETRDEREQEVGRSETRDDPNDGDARLLELIDRKLDNEIAKAAQAERPGEMQILRKIRVVFRPTWNPKIGAVSCYVSTPEWKKRDGRLLGEAIFATGVNEDTAMLIDLLVLRSAIDSAMTLVERKTPAIIVAPIRYLTLSGKHKARTLEMLTSIPKSVTPYFIVDLVGITGDSSKSLIGANIQSFARYCRAVAGRAQIQRPNIPGLTELNLSFIGLDVTSANTSGALQSLPGQIETFPQKGKASGFDTYLWGVDDPAIFKAAVKAGYTLINGAPIGAPVKAPTGAFKVQPKL